MNILTFDIEDWYNCDFISKDLDWNKYEVRIHEGVDRILKVLDEKNIRATFFCLGWIAENHPNVIKKIDSFGHHLGCHSYQHELIPDQDKKQFEKLTYKSKSLIENLTGKEVNAYRAPGFSISEKQFWALEIIEKLGFKYDCSIFPGKHDYGGFLNYGRSEPKLLKFKNEKKLKEFPVNNIKIFKKNIIFSGGGFFRLFPYVLIKKWSKDSKYLMTYFHTRDFDAGQPILKSLPKIRRFKSYVGLKKSFFKFNTYLNDFNFIDIETADKMINWEKAPSLNF